MWKTKFAFFNRSFSAGSLAQMPGIGGAGPASMSRSMFQNLTNMPRTSVLYAEILNLLATIISRAKYDIAKKVITRLNSQSNQWYRLTHLLKL